MKIDIKFEDVREGDFVTLSYCEREFNGFAWADHSEGELRVGFSFLEKYGGSAEHMKFISASREVPLPTGIGAVIRTRHDVLVRVSSELWQHINSRIFIYPDSDVVERYEGFEILSEGVEIERK